MGAAWSREEELTLLLRPSFRSRCIASDSSLPPGKGLPPGGTRSLGQLQARQAFRADLFRKAGSLKGGVFCVSWGETGTQQTGVWVWFLFQEQVREHWVGSTV